MKEFNTKAIYLTQLLKDILRKKLELRIEKSDFLSAEVKQIPR